MLRLRWHSWRTAQLREQGKCYDHASKQAYEEVIKMKNEELLAWGEEHPYNASGETTVPPV